MRISDWSSDVCSSDLGAILHNRLQQASEVGDLELVGAEAAAILVVRGLGSPPVVRAALRAGAMIIHDGHPWIASLCGFAGLFVQNAADLPRRIVEVEPYRAMYRRLLVRRTISDVGADFLEVDRKSTRLTYSH